MEREDDIIIGTPTLFRCGNGVVVPESNLQRGSEKGHFSFSFWLYMTHPIENNTVIISKGSTISISVNNNKILFVLQHTNSLNSEKEVNLNHWTHICCNYYNNFMSIWFDGVEDVKYQLNTIQFKYDPLPLIVAKGFSGLLSDVRWSVHPISTDNLKFFWKSKPKYPPETTPPLLLTIDPIKSVKELGEWDLKINGQNTLHCVCSKPLKKRRENKKGNPQVIHCHDMAGNYLEDRFINGGKSFHVYNFNSIMGICGTQKWSQGFGMFIKCSKGLKDKLIDIASFYGFDGWFFNFESKVPSDYVPKIVAFLKYITGKCHEKIPESLILWYDSIIDDGSVKWQNCLNQKNKMFFDSCDGIFLNYGWKEDYVVQSADLAGHKNLNVYTGIDIWGRGTFGGGGFNTKQALEVIYNYPSKGKPAASSTSVGLFAPGWTFENLAPHDRSMFDRYEAKYWTGHDFIDLMEDNKQEWVILENGGNGWKSLETHESYNGQSKMAFVTSHGWCKRNKLIDLYQSGLSSSVLNLSPNITISEWYCGTPPKTEDLFYLHVKLLDHNMNVLTEFNSGTWDHL